MPIVGGKPEPTERITPHQREILWGMGLLMLQEIAVEIGRFTRFRERLIAKQAAEPESPRRMAREEEIQKLWFRIQRLQEALPGAIVDAHTAYQALSVYSRRWLDAQAGRSFEESDFQAIAEAQQAVDWLLSIGELFRVMRGTWWREEETA